MRTGAGKNDDYVTVEVKKEMVDYELKLLERERKESDSSSGSIEGSH